VQTTEAVNTTLAQSSQAWAQQATQAAKQPGPAVQEQERSQSNMATMSI
jgi:hypothetical protein